MPAPNDFARLFDDIPDDLRQEASREALRDTQTRSPTSARLAEIESDVILAFETLADTLDSLDDFDVSPQAGTAAVMLLLTRALAGLPNGFDDEAIQSVAIVARHLATLPEDERDTKLHELAGGFLAARDD